MVILLTAKISVFLSKNTRNKIYFWYCLSKAKWPRYKLVDNQVKKSSNVPELPNKNSFLFRKKKECDDILCK